MRYDDIPTLATWKNDTSILRKAASGSTLNKLDAELEKYEKAFTPMAKRNLLSDMNYHIRKWEITNGTTVSFHQNVVALKEVIARKLKELSPSAYKYRKTILLGFDIGCNSGGDYFRRSDYDVVDMRSKCSELMHAIKHAQTMVTASGFDDDETLKIFMAPEFYFRGANGAYGFDVASQIIPSMEELGTERSVYDHWLFVFGTAVAASESVVTFCPTCGYSPDGVIFNRDPASRQDANGNHKKTQGVCAKDPTHVLAMGSFGAEVQNVALIKKGSDTHMVVKEYISGIDYISNQVNVIQGTKKNRSTNTLGVAPPAGSNFSRIASKFQDERMGGGVFTMDGITFGMEICLDHIKSTGANGRLSDYANSIQILLIPSYGMDITHHSCVVGGIIFNVDGRGTGSSNVVVKGSVGPINGKPPAAAPKTRGKIEMYGPLVIPKRG